MALSIPTGIRSQQQTQLTRQDPNVRTAAAPADPRALEMGRKVDQLVRDRFGGDYQRAFQHYSGGAREVSREGVMRMLNDAGVGNGLSRGFYADGVMDAFDTNRNRGVSWGEFQNGLRGAGVSVGG